MIILPRIQTTFHPSFPYPPSLWIPWSGIPWHHAQPMIERMNDVEFVKTPILFSGLRNIKLDIAYLTDVFTKFNYDENYAFIIEK